MTSKLKCPFCGEEIKIAGERTTIMSCFNGECCGSGLYGEEAMWQALIQSKQQLKMLEPIVASLQGRADINAEVARDSNELVVQWYEKYEQTQKDLEIATKALENIVSDYEVDASNGWLAANAKRALETIGKHKE